jgi:hypothetical protein
MAQLPESFFRFTFSFDPGAVNYKLGLAIQSFLVGLASVLFVVHEALVFRGRSLLRFVPDDRARHSRKAFCEGI